MTSETGFAARAMHKESCRFRRPDRGCECHRASRDMTAPWQWRPCRRHGGQHMVEPVSAQSVAVGSSSIPSLPTSSPAHIVFGDTARIRVRLMNSKLLELVRVEIADIGL